MTHREYIGDVIGTSDFNVSAYPINPAVAKTFPFLSRIASLFEEYDFEGLVFQYVTTSGMVGSVSPALGAVIMATDYDSYAPNFVTKQQMESYEGAISTVACENTAHGVECARNEKHSRNLYTRTGPYSGSLLDYDFGKFQIATKGMPTDTVVGELWVTYDVVLLKPRLPTSFFGVPLLALQASYNSRGTAGGALAFPSQLPQAIQLENTRVGTPWFFDMSQGYSNWKGQPFGYDPGQSGLYILTKSRWIVSYQHSNDNQNNGFVLGSTVNPTLPGAYTYFIASTVAAGAKVLYKQYPDTTGGIGGSYANSGYWLNTGATVVTATISSTSVFIRYDYDIGSDTDWEEEDVVLDRRITIDSHCYTAAPNASTASVQPISSYWRFVLQSTN